MADDLAEELFNPGYILIGRTCGLTGIRGVINGVSTDRWLCAQFGLCRGIYRQYHVRRSCRDRLTERDLNVDYRTMWKFVHTQGLSFKKTTLASEQERPDVARRRLRWKTRQAKVDPRRLVFVDETWTKTSMVPLRGRSPRGQRCHGLAPFGHWNTMTFLAALRCNRIDTPWVLDGPIDGPSFRTYVERILVPTLLPGDIAVLDNLASHKSKAVRQAIRQAGTKLLFLPPYSPNLNPIEQGFAKLKHLMRKAAERTKAATWKRIGTLLDAFTQREYANYLVNSGIDST